MREVRSVRRERSLKQEIRKEEKKNKKNNKKTYIYAFCSTNVTNFCYILIWGDHGSIRVRFMSNPRPTRPSQVPYF